MALLVGPRPTPQLLFLKREDDGREGAISGRLARKATGVSPSGFARTGVLAGKEGASISPDTAGNKVGSVVGYFGLRLGKGLTKPR